MIFLQTEQIVNKALEINPYGTAAIGVLFAVLLVAIGFLWVQLGKKDKSLLDEIAYGRELSEKVISLTTKVGVGFDNDREFKTRLDQNISDIRQEFKLLDQFIRSDANHTNGDKKT